MTILVVEDDPDLRSTLEELISDWGHRSVAAPDGETAVQVLQAQPAPLAIIDWMLPGMDGLAVCKHIRETPGLAGTYVIFLTAKGGVANKVTGLENGADDYITKPFELEELRARVLVGLRILELQRTLAARVHDLEDAFHRVKQLQGLLPICCYCKRIRNDQNSWQELEAFLTTRSDVQFSHGICPECYQTVLRTEAIDPSGLPS